MRFFLAAVLLALAFICSHVHAGHGKYWYNEVTQKVQWEEPTYMHKDKQGNFYYIDPKDGSTTWTKPKEFAWTVRPAASRGGPDPISAARARVPAPRQVSRHVTLTAPMPARLTHRRSTPTASSTTTA